MQNKIVWKDSTKLSFENDDELWNSWRSEQHHFDQAFIQDGIISTEKWKLSEFKIMFLLKEAYTEDNDFFSLTDWLRDVDLNKYRMWKNLSIWSFLIQSVLKGNPIQNLPLKATSEMTETLKSCAIVNLKKSNGKSKTDPLDLYSYSEKDEEYLKYQISSINPDIIFCGYTFGYVKDWVLNLKLLEDRIYYSSNVIWVDFWHPANQFPKVLNFHALKSIFNKPKLVQLLKASKDANIN